MQYDLTRKTRPVVIVPYDPQWPREFAALGGELRDALGDEAARIDHVGSTAVPKLAAKDVIDVQITVPNLGQTDVFCQRMTERGYRQRRGADFVFDEFTRLDDPSSPELRKRYFREREGSRRVHIHVRELGRFNQRYALLFRDYLRSSPAARDAYATLKTRLSKIFPESIDGYLFIKGPSMDLIYEAADLWASKAGWTPDGEHL